MTTREAVTRYRNTARVVGAMYLAGMVVYVTGNSIVQSIVTGPDHLAAVPAHSLRLAMGAMLMMLAVIWDAAHGILMLPILKPHGERAAYGYLGYRMVEAVILAVGILFILLQIPLGNETLQAGAAERSSLQALSTIFLQGGLYTYEIAMLFLGLAGVLLCYVLYRAKLTPRFMAMWGLVGNAVLFGGSFLQLLGFDLALIHTIPGGLWELFFGVWLIWKGFNASAFDTRATETGHLAEPVIPLTDPINP